MTRLLLALILALFCPVPAHASAPPPIIRATQSTNGQSLVLIDYKLAPPNAAGGQFVLATTFQVLAPALLNPGQRISAPITIWSTPTWAVTIPHGGNLWPMISNDGNTLLLLHVQPATPHQVLFDIYRRHFADATFIRSVYVDELWTRRELDPSGKGGIMIYDSTPLWFSTGSLAFSPDGQTLRYETKWKDHLRIDLTNGAVSRVQDVH